MAEQRRARLQVEQLEDRTVPAGNVAVSLFDPTPNAPGDETVFIVGDDLSNNIILAVVPLQQGNYNAGDYFTNQNFAAGRWLFVFDGDGSTQISGGQLNGGNWAAVLMQDINLQGQGTVEARQIVVNLGQGSDTLQVNYFDSRQANVGGGGGGTPIPQVLVFSPGPSPSDTSGVQLNMGQGQNSVTITGAEFLGTLSIASGDGDDTIDLNSGIVVQGDLRLQLGRGNNSVRLASNIRIDGQLFMSSSDGDDSLNLDGSVGGLTIGGNLNFVAGNGNNLLSVLGSSVNGQLYYRAGTGNDRLVLRQSNFGIGIEMSSGSGSDYFEMFRSTFGVSPDGIGQISGRVRFVKVAGDGSFKLLQSSVHGDLQLSLNSGNDSVVVQSSQIDGLVSLYTYGPGADRDLISINGSRFYSNFTLRTGAGNDFITIAGRSQFYGNVLLDAGTGNDVVQVSNNSFYARLSVALGAGNDFANFLSNRFFGSSAIIDGGSGLDQISQSRNQGNSYFRNFP